MQSIVTVILIGASLATIAYLFAVVLRGAIYLNKRSKADIAFIVFLAAVIVLIAVIFLYNLSYI